MTLKKAVKEEQATEEGEGRGAENLNIYMKSSFTFTNFLCIL